MDITIIAAIKTNALCGMIKVETTQGFKSEIARWKNDRIAAQAFRLVPIIKRAAPDYNAATRHFATHSFPPIMPPKLAFDTPEGPMLLSIPDAQFMAYEAGDVAMREPRELVTRMRLMGLGDLAEHHVSLIAQSKLTVMELREAREDAEALLASGQPFEDTITPRLEILRETITRTQLAMRSSVDRLSALSVACHAGLCELPGYRPPMQGA